MAFKLRSGNKVNFKEIGSSPFRAEGEGDDSNSAGNFDWANATVSGADGPEFDPTSQSKSELGSLVDESRSQADIDKEQAKKDIIAYLEDNVHQLRELSLRTALKLADLRVLNGERWKLLADTTILRRGI